MLEPAQTRLRAALAERALTLTDVAHACGVSRPAVSQWFADGPSWRPIPARHMAAIRELLRSPAKPANHAEAFLIAHAPPAASPRARQAPAKPVNPATGPLHSDFVAAHNRASQRGERSPFPLD